MHMSQLRKLFVGLYIFAGISLSAASQETAPNEWTWLAGSQIVTNANGMPGTYGSLGIPDGTNLPGGRDSAATWTDQSGNFWLFGGEGSDANGSFGQLNDLWEFNPSTLEATWMGGSDTVPAGCAGSTTTPCGRPGVYGTRGSPGASNVPGSRSSASFWRDREGNFWLFGGFGFDANQTLGELNDLWKFNPSTSEWTWIGGSNTVGINGGRSGVYGTLGSPSTANIPSGRYSATYWIDKSGTFWLYGGEGFDSQGNSGQLNDLWQFDPDRSEWTWTSGSNTLPDLCPTGIFSYGLCGWPAVYGPLGKSSSSFGPGSRLAAASWTGKEGNLWLFGGTGSIFWEDSDFSEVDQYDLWELNPSTNQWAWESGDTTSICGESSSQDTCAQDGAYGTQGVPAISNNPPSRSSSNSWSDSNGNLWVFGGAQAETTNESGANLCNDVWVFETAADEWAWMNGTAGCSNIYGKYGVRGKPAIDSDPSGRLGSASWINSKGNLWIFGGYGWADGVIGPTIYELNDFWEYTPPAVPSPTPSFEMIASPNPINIPAMGPNVITPVTGTTKVSVIPADGFDSPVTLTYMGGALPYIFGSLNPTVLNGSGSSTLTLTVSPPQYSVAGPYPVTINATGGGISQSIQVIVDVTTVGQMPAPTFSVPTGTYSKPQAVTISGSNFIYFTTDGSTPSPSSPVYVNPITISASAKLKAFVMDTGNNQSSVSSATYTILNPTSTTTVTAIPSAATVGQAITLKATVSGSQGTPTGSIIFSLDGITLGSAALNGSGIASFTAGTGSAPAGAYDIIARYSGNSIYNPSTSSATSVSLSKASTTTTLVASPNSVTPPGSVTLTAKVSRSESGATGIPAGSVTYSAGDSVLGSAKLNAAGIATFSASSAGVNAGSYPVIAAYDGDASDNGSSSAVKDVTVK